MGHPDVTEPLEMFEAGEPEKAHEALCVCFEEQMDDIVDGLRKAFPERARHVEQAVAAHRRREYALSIPVFLLEADGICQELVGAQAYQKEGGQRAIANAISSRARDDAFHLAMCAALITITPLVYGPKERAQHGMTDSVNRHTVLHGEDVNYDTRRNSCQALSFLAHVVSVLPDLKAPPTE